MKTRLPARLLRRPESCQEMSASASSHGVPRPARPAADARGRHAVNERLCACTDCGRTLPDVAGWPQRCEECANTTSHVGIEVLEEVGSAAGSTRGIVCRSSASADRTPWVRTPGPRVRRSMGRRRAGPDGPDRQVQPSGRTVAVVSIRAGTIPGRRSIGASVSCPSIDAGTSGLSGQANRTNSKLCACSSPDRAHACGA